MSKPVLAIDIDDVIFPFTEITLRLHNEKHGTELEVEDISSYYYLEELKGLSTSDEVEEYLDEFFAEVYEGRIKPNLDAQRAINLLKDKYEIDIITARRPTTRKVTEQWLKHHFPDMFRDVHFPRELADPATPKPQICKQIGAVAIVDDHIDNLIGCAELGIKALLFGSYPWSKDWKLPEGVKRVNTWDEVLEELL
jgi:uncharacterized HAD superfamily protein